MMWKFEEKQVSEDEYILSGRLELDHLKEKYDLDFPENDSETLSVLLYNSTKPFPLKRRIIISNYEFEVLNVGDTRIEMGTPESAEITLFFLLTICLQNGYSLCSLTAWYKTAIACDFT